jgi:CubicO group peptidase (beta-lactamase class C family)
MTRSMSGRGLLLAAALVAGVGTAACDEEDLPVHGEGAPGIDQSINADVLGFLGDNGGAGATVAVTRDGRLVWSKGYGWANRSERIQMQPWHRSRIGSVSKVMTAIGLLQLLERDGDPSAKVAVGPDSLATRLAQKVYGDPGADVTGPDWPHVTGPTVLADPDRYWEAIRDGVAKVYGSTYDSDMARTIDWASRIELRHLLSHTSGLLRSGSADKAAAHYGVDIAELTYPDIHTWVLGAGVTSQLGGTNFTCMVDPPYDEVDEAEAAAPDDSEPRYPVPPLLFEPGTKECYSNHGFGLTGHIIDELSGPGEDNTYRRVIERGVLHPLGLTTVVPKNTDIGDLDAWPHGSRHDPSDLNPLGLSTGGWVATARDLARVMCGLDRGADNLRLLRPETVTAMETDVASGVSGIQPVGWDYGSGSHLYKNGATAGGKSVIIKYLPGSFPAAPNDEINIAMNLNGGAPMPAESLLRAIATKVAAADIAEEYDLFDPAYPCVVDRSPGGLVRPTVTERPTPSPTPGGLVVVTPGTTATPSPTRGRPGSVVAPTRPPRPTPPTVFIREPAAGQHGAPRGVASIDFYGAATDSTGRRIAGTNLRWTATQGGVRTVLCAGIDIGPGTTPPVRPTRGLAVRTDCTRFSRRLPNPVAGTGPPITIRLEARDRHGTIGIATVTIRLFTATGR